MAVNLNARLKNLEQKFNPVIGKKIMIFADDADSCAVDDITVYRLPNEDADAFFDRCTELYDRNACGSPALTIRVRCAENMPLV